MATKRVSENDTNIGHYLDSYDVIEAQSTQLEPFARPSNSSISEKVKKGIAKFFSQPKKTAVETRPPQNTTPIQHDPVKPKQPAQPKEINAEYLTVNSQLILTLSRITGFNETKIRSTLFNYTYELKLTQQQFTANVKTLRESFTATEVEIRTESSKYSASMVCNDDLIIITNPDTKESYVVGQLDLRPKVSHIDQIDQSKFCGFTEIQQQALIAVEKKHPHVFVDSMTLKHILDNKTLDDVGALEDITIITNAKINKDIKSNSIDSLCLILTTTDDVKLKPTKPKPLAPARAVMKPTPESHQQATAQISDVDFTSDERTAFDLIKKVEPKITEADAFIVKEKGLLGKHLINIILKRFNPDAGDCIHDDKSAAKMILSSITDYKNEQIKNKKTEKKNYTVPNYSNSVSADNTIYSTFSQNGLIQDKQEFNSYFSLIPSGKYTDQTLITAFTIFKQLQTVPTFANPTTLKTFTPMNFAILLHEKQLEEEPWEVFKEMLNLPETAKQVNSPALYNTWLSQAHLTLSQYHGESSQTIVPTVESLEKCYQPTRNGLYNWGNLCFFNATLQCYAHTYHTSRALSDCLTRPNSEATSTLISSYIRTNPKAFTSLSKNDEREYISKSVRKIDRLSREQLIQSGFDLTYNHQRHNLQPYLISYFELQDSFVNLLTALNAEVYCNTPRTSLTQSELQSIFFTKLYRFAKLTDARSLLHIIETNDQLSLNKIVQSDPQEVMSILCEIFGIEGDNNLALNYATTILFHHNNRFVGHHKPVQTKSSLLTVCTDVDSGKTLQAQINSQFKGQVLLGDEAVKCPHIASSMNISEADIISSKAEYFTVNDANDLTPEVCAVSVKLWSPNGETLLRARSSRTDSTLYPGQKVALGGELLANLIRTNRVGLPFKLNSGEFYIEEYRATSVICRVGERQVGGHYISINIPDTDAFDLKDLTVCDDSVCLPLDKYFAFRGYPILNPETGKELMTLNDAFEKSKISGYAYFLKKQHADKFYRTVETPIITADPYQSLLSFTSVHEIESKSRNSEVKKNRAGSPLRPLRPQLRPEESQQAPQHNRTNSSVVQQYPLSRAAGMRNNYQNVPQYSNQQYIDVDKLPAPQYSSSLDPLPQGIMRPQANPTPNRIQNNGEVRNLVDFQNGPASKSEQYRKVLANKPQLQPQLTAVSQTLAQPLVVTQPPVPAPRRRIPQFDASNSAQNFSKIRDSHLVDTPEEVREVVSEATNLTPWDPNLTCPHCDKKHRIGDIQLFRAHANKCEATSPGSRTPAINTNSTQLLVIRNVLQDGIDKDIKHEADRVARTDTNSGSNLNSQAPFDPNLICPLCMKNFKIGEIQPYRKHVNTCQG